MPVFTGGGLQSGLDPALQAYADPLTTFRPGAGSAFGPGLGTAPAPGGIRTPQAAAGQNATVKQAQATANLTSAQAGAVQQKLDLQRELFRALFGPSGQGGGFLGELLGLGNRAVDKVGGGANLGGPVVGGSAAESLVGQLQGYGAGERNRINQQTQDTIGSALAQLELRGFGGSPSLVGGSLGAINQAQNQSLLDLGDQLIGKQVGVQENALNRNNQLLGSLLGSVSSIL